MQNNNPYNAPDSDLNRPSTARGGSVEKALAGEVNWMIGDVIGEAWQTLSGFKGTYWLGLAIYIGVSFLVGFVFGFLGGGSETMALVSQLVVTLVTLPILAGLYILGIRRAADLPVSAGMVTQYFGKMLSLFFMTILMGILLTIGYLLLILPGIYLTVAYALAIPLMVEKDMGIWEALETSRKAVTKCWFPMFALFIVITLLMMLSAIPLGIGLIWTVPMAMLALGIVYREMFGVEAG